MCTLALTHLHTRVYTHLYPRILHKPHAHSHLYAHAHSIDTYSPTILFSLTHIHMNSPHTCTLTLPHMLIYTFTQMHAHNHAHSCSHSCPCLSHSCAPPKNWYPLLPAPSSLLWLQDSGFTSILGLQLCTWGCLVAWGQSVGHIFPNPSDASFSDENAVQSLGVLL